ncbi:hypothetical protein NIES4071_103260 (plasmid) [Calothrix sp. NIES-4071]|nr:hypothetical protein NIES4071_103260 [Calothrix sp. NIES-4071]BAZ64707.1 hypothetical protein NIES4105_104400 [Calothrix sp. NIES-4105]
MPDIVEHRNRALGEFYSTIVVGCVAQTTCTLLGVAAGWYTVQPPVPEKVVIKDVFPIVSGGLWGAGVGFALALIVVTSKLKELKDGRF